MDALHTSTEIPPGRAESYRLTFRDSADAMRFVEDDHDDRSRSRQREALRDVHLGRAMIMIRDEHDFSKAKFLSFEHWAAGRVKCDKRQRDRLLAAGRLDPALVENRIISRQKLGAIGGQPEWLHATLVDLGEDTKEADLTLAAKSAILHLERHQDTAAALVHAQGVAHKQETPLLNESRMDSLATLIEVGGGGAESAAGAERQAAAAARRRAVAGWLGREGEPGGDAAAGVADDPEVAVRWGTEAGR